MIILLGIMGEIVTIIGSAAITMNAAINSLLEIPKNGYKIDKNILEEYKKRRAQEEKKKVNFFNRILGVILLLVPGVNLINASIKGNKVKKSVINDPQIKELIVPMNEKEKEQFAKTEGRLKKLSFAVFTSVKENEEEEFFGFIGERPIVVDHGLTSLYYEQLIPLDYTLNEVKKLNEATSYSYRIGKIDDKNIAIIGIPNLDSPVSRIQFKKEDYKITHTYEKMTEEEAQNKTFIVYQYTINEDTQENVEKVIEEIKKSRVNYRTKSNVKALDKYSKFEEKVIPTETEIILSEEQGPRLVKTIRKNERK